MLGKSLASTLLTFESGACCSIPFSDRATPTTNVVQHTLNSSCRVRLKIQRNMSGDGSGNFFHVKRWTLHAIDQAQVAVLEDEEKKTWEECKQTLTAFNFATHEADVMLKKAFGWVHSPYWGEERRKEVPKNELVSGVLDYLKSLGLSDDDVHKLLKKFPEVLGCSLDDEVKMNISTLEKEWGIKGKALRNLLLRNPKVLGYNVDCKGDCMAQCTRCWVRF